MTVLKDLLDENESLDYQEAYNIFWYCFIDNESIFFEIVKSRENIEDYFRKEIDL